MRYHRSSFRQWAVMTYAAFITGYYSWHRHLRLSHCAVEVLHGCSFALFCVLRYFWRPPCTDFSVAKSLMKVVTAGFPIPVAASCNAAVITSQLINLVFGLRCLCRWSADARPVASALFTALETTVPVPNWASVASLPYTSFSLHRTVTFRNKKFIHHPLSSTYVHNIRHFAWLLCWAHVTDWNTDDTGGVGQCRFPLSKARNSSWRHIWKKK
jgi:hypothetical protein